MPAPTITDLFGEGAVYSGGVLTIPRGNLPNFSPTSTNKKSALTALLILLHSYFEGEISDWDGEAIEDDQGDTLGYSQNREGGEIGVEFAAKTLSLDETTLFWDYLFSLYTPSDSPFA